MVDSGSDLRSSSMEGGTITMGLFDVGILYKLFLCYILFNVSIYVSSSNIDYEQ